MPKPVGVARLTSPAQEDYLKALFVLAPGDKPVAPSGLAAELGVSVPSASEMVAKLAALKLVEHDAYRGARLTPAGRAIAVEIVRHHRLLETYLVTALGYGWDEVHEEADRLEHAISERLEQRIWEALGSPSLDPHGDPIPSPSGEIPALELLALDRVPEGSRVCVSRISDRDPNRLRAIRALGLLPLEVLDVVRESEWEGPIQVRLHSRLLDVPLGLARAVFVTDAAG